MTEFFFLVPISIGLGIIGLLAFLWSLKQEQYDDLDGASFRILQSDDVPIQKNTVAEDKRAEFIDSIGK